MLKNKNGIILLFFTVWNVISIHFYKFNPILAQDKTHVDSERMYLCQVNATGVHPLVQVMDIRCDELGKSFLWQMFGIDSMNTSLQQISPDPMAYVISMNLKNLKKNRRISQLIFQF